MLVTEPVTSHQRSKAPYGSEGVRISITLALRDTQTATVSVIDEGVGSPTGSERMKCGDWASGSSMRCLSRWMARSVSIADHRVRRSPKERGNFRSHAARSRITRK